MWNLFGRKKKEVVPIFLEMQLRREQASYIWEQEMEDQQCERDARHEARDMFEQWRADPNGILVAKPIRCILTVYLGQKAKYDNEEYNELRRRYFKEMKGDYLMDKRSRF